MAMFFKELEVLINDAIPMKFTPILSIAIFLSICPSNIHSQDVPLVSHIIDDTYDGADGVRLGDVNGDGFMDVATGFEEAGVTAIYVHPGYENVGDKWPRINAGNTPSVEDTVFAGLDGVKRSQRCEILSNIYLPKICNQCICNQCILQTKSHHKPMNLHDLSQKITDSVETDPTIDNRYTHRFDAFGLA